MYRPFTRQEPCPGSGAVAVNRLVTGRRGRCTACGRAIKLRADGTLWRHVAVYTINYPPE